MAREKMESNFVANLGAVEEEPGAGDRGGGLPGVVRRLGERKERVVGL